MRTGRDVQITMISGITRPSLVTIGNHVGIDVGVYISVKATIGDYVHIAPYACIIGGANAELIMEDFSGISAGCKVICASDDFTQGMLNPTVPAEFRNVICKPVVFRRFACIGVNTVVLPGVTLAEGSVVGAGSVVTKDTEPWTIYAGSPAKAIGTRDKTWILESIKKLGYE